MKTYRKRRWRKKPVRIGEKHYEDGQLNPKIERLLAEADIYVKHEVIVFFPRLPTDDEIREVEATLEKVGFNIKRKIKCDNCDIRIQLWQAENLHTIVNADGVISGSGPTKTGGVGEDYSLNFKNIIPYNGKNIFCRKTGDVDKKKKKIVVAVLDTGIDTDIVDPNYLWDGSDTNLNSDCYRDVTSGWNFTWDALDPEARIGNSDFRDDNEGRHGSLISQYIINQFTNSPDRRVEIMPLKTHDKDGVGDLYRILCAIHFAIAKKADIINASWGLYYYAQEPIPYVKDLITKRLKEEGILFIAAAGNKDERADQIARELYSIDPGGVLSDDQLRNLEIHNFYPANLSRPDNPVITVTTTNGKKVSPRQNYSDELVDLGIMADKKRAMAFELPFETAAPAPPIPGSSFAAAIATGIIGAHCPLNLFRRYNAAGNTNKSDFLQYLNALLDGAPGKITLSDDLARKYIIKGAWTKK